MSFSNLTIQKYLNSTIYCTFSYKEKQFFLFFSVSFIKDFRNCYFLNFVLLFIYFLKYFIFLNFFSFQKDFFAPKRFKMVFYRDAQNRWHFSMVFFRDAFFQLSNLFARISSLDFFFSRSVEDVPFNRSLFFELPFSKIFLFLKNNFFIFLTR